MLKHDYTMGIELNNNLAQLAGAVQYTDWFSAEG